MIRKPEIVYSPLGQPDGDYYVHDLQNFDDYLDGYAIHDGYLHSDGVWREKTQNEQTGRYTGWFKSKGEARKAIRLYKSRLIHFTIGRNSYRHNTRRPAWYVMRTGNPFQYLHHDGTVKTFAGESGYFKTRKAAREAAKAYREKHN